MNPIIQELKNEHQILLAMIDEQKILPMIDFVEDIHHPKEEELLFPLMAQHPLLRQGGPRCMYFRGLELEMRVHAPAQNLLKEYYALGGPRPSEYKNFEWLSENNPLSIPMYEHVLGHELASAIRHLLKGSLNFTVPAQLLNELYNEYCRLLKLHIEKEDTCLFLIAENILGSP